MKNLERIRWRTRRGLLELDILLERFVAQGYGQLDQSEQAVFEALLDLPDNNLLDLMLGNTPAASPQHKALLEKMTAV